MDGRMPNEWVLVCSGRVLGAKSPSAVDTLLRIHKKKCDICRKATYLCIDEGVAPKRFKSVDKLKQNIKDYDERNCQLQNLIEKMESVV
jgi:hypothetical protein